MLGPTAAALTRHVPSIMQQLGPVAIPAAAQSSAAAAALAATASTTAARLHFNFFVGFLCGGLFFSTVVAAIGAAYAFGIDNVQRARRECLLVARRTLAVVVAAFKAAFAAITDDDQRWTAAIRELREGFSRATRVAAEGVEAISLQRDLYSAAVGIPGLPLQQYIVDRLYADDRYMATALEQACRDTLRGLRNERVRELRVRKFSAGSVPPKLLAARAYDAPDALAFDVETRWPSELSLDLDLVVGGRGPLSGARVPVAVRNLLFEGHLRLVATPLLAAAPGFGALLVSLREPPRISFDVSVAGGEVTKLPWLRDEIEQAVQGAIAKDLLWPNRLVLPTASAPGVEPPPVLDRARLKALEADDPLLRAERALESQPAVSALAKERAPAARLNTLLEIFVNSTKSVVAG